MIRNITLTTFIVLLIAVLFSGNSAGPANVQGADRTGSPLSSGACGIAGCHSGGAFAPTITLTLLRDGNPVTRYEPGEDYRLRMTVQAGSGAPAGYGFQAVALTGADNRNAGAFSDLPDGAQITRLRGRDYVEHGRRFSVNTFEVKWTAPVEGDEVDFYAAGLAVNGNGSSSGDEVAVLPAPLTVSPLVSSPADATSLPVEWTLGPNPSTDLVNMFIYPATAGNYLISLYDINGRRLRNRSVQWQEGENVETLDLRTLPAGQYQIRLSDGRRTAARTVIRR